MARLKDRSVDEVKAAADLVDVVSLRTSLRRVSGNRFSGRCPFHEEKTPSFSVDPVKKLYHCFGCGKGGDVVTFVRETENLDFTGAIEWLADRFRITLEYEESSPRAEEARRRRERMFSVLDHAATFFERFLWEADAGAPVRAYLAERGLGDEIARTFRLGLSPGRGLVERAREKGFTLDELRAAGLANARGKDYFPFRLMFPLADARGKIVGFQARRIRDDDPLAGKYVNTPESELFKKGAVLYGLHLARTAIAKDDRAVVVEGNTDVIALHQAGFTAAVAAMGTALTEGHLRELGRLTKRLYLCFDADAAGQAATLRGMELAVVQGFDVRVVSLPVGTDPADDPQLVADGLGAAESYLHYRVRIAIEQAGDRQEAYVRARELLERAEDSPERQEAVRLLADRLDLPRETLGAIGAARAGSTVAPSTAEPPRVLEAALRLERDALAACVAHTDLIPLLEAMTADHFTDPRHRRLRDALVTPGVEDDDLVALRAELGARADRDELDERAGRELLLRLRERHVRRALQTDDLVRATELQAQLAKIRQAILELA